MTFMNFKYENKVEFKTSTSILGMKNDNHSFENPCDRERRGYGKVNINIETLLLKVERR